MPTAQDINGLTGVRADLVSKGIANDRIGWNQNTGMVTIDGQDFLKPTTVVKGTSYADPTAYSNAYNVFDTNQKAKTAETNFLNAINNPAANPYDSQVNDFLSQITNKINNPDPYNVYADPGYAAYQAQADRNAQRSIRAAQEAYGASGFGRSTQVGERAQNIQNQADEYMQLQIVPQLTSAHQAQQAQELSNLFGVLNALGGQQSVYDNRNSQQTGFLSDLLGYTTGRADRAADTQYKTVRDAVADMQYADQVAYQKERDKIADEQAKKTFDENVRQFGLNYALDQQQMKQSAASAAASNALAREKFEYEKQQDASKAAADASAGLSQKDLQSEASEMISALRSNKLTPQAAYQQIADDERLGIYSKENADYLRSQLEAISPQLKQPEVPDNQLSSLDPNMLSDKQIEAEARAKGLPTLDYRSWYKSANGRLGGVDFATWKRLYGPRLE